MVNFLEGKICLNCLTQSIENAKKLNEITEGHILLGLLSGDYETNELAIEDIKRYQEHIDNNISVGLGSGNPNNWKRVADISSKVSPKHINQVFSGVGYTRAINENFVFINCLVSPTDDPNYVSISTGPLSSKSEEKAIVNVETAVILAKEMGANSIKFFPMGGLKSIDGLIELSKACAKYDFAVEPTGGLDLDNFEPIVEAVLANGVKRVIPHVYSSIIDGETKVESVEKLYSIMKKLVKKY